ncbi:MAG: hypothetical protein IJX77_07455 [Ruminococcus sp.]|nr:hypothetical protein [Ruminococcus sp.]
MIGNMITAAQASPVTGDSTPITAMLIIIGVAAVGLIVSAVMKKFKK